MQSFATELDAPLPAPLALAPLALEGQPLLDLRHLNHQTLGDPLLRNDVLELFLAETPKYIADLKAASDCKSWRMAVHTLKGVSLNLGAFRLAQVCRQFEGPEAAGTVMQMHDAALAIATLILETRQAIDAVMPKSALPRG